MRDSIKNWIGLGMLIAGTALGGFAGGKLHELANKGEYAAAQQRYEQMAQEDWFARACSDKFIGRRNAESTLYTAAHSDVFFARKFSRGAGYVGGFILSLVLASTLCSKREDDDSSSGSSGTYSQGSDPETWTRTSGERPLGLG
jgi:hypothetical protein